METVQSNYGYIHVMLMKCVIRNTHNSHLLFMEEVIRGYNGLTQFTSESSYGLCYVAL